MLQLPLHFIKDAARSVKRVCLDNFTKAKDSVLTDLLGIPTLIVTMYSLTREGDHEVLHLWCNHRDDIAVCPDCGTLSDSIHSERHRCVRHLDIWGKKTFLHFLSRRFKCGNCGQVFNEQLPFIDEHRRQTIALEQFVYESCLSSNRKKVAKQIGLSQSTVRDIFNRFAQIKVDYNEVLLTRVLGIDEISLKNTADKVGISPQYLSRYFKEKYGQNFITYIKKSKFDFAKSLLLSSNEKIFEISKKETADKSTYPPFLNMRF